SLSQQSSRWPSAWSSATTRRARPRTWTRSRPYATSNPPLRERPYSKRAITPSAARFAFSGQRVIRFSCRPEIGSRRASQPDFRRQGNASEMTEQSSQTAPATATTLARHGGGVAEAPAKPRILSGMRPTGRLHLGNLVGALQNWVRLQDEYDSYHFVADWHMLTTDYANTTELQNNVQEMVTDWLAAGLDPKKATFFIQSRIIEHAELHLIFSMITPLGWLERVPSYKEQLENVKDRDLHTYGFLGYPVLQAADILMYKANAVPVGEDQVPHVELTREIARRFNAFYGPVFPEPRAQLTPAPRLPGTDGRKMSKSYNNAIFLSDPTHVVSKKLATMITDPARKRRTDKGDPDKCPVFDLHKVFSTGCDQQGQPRMPD